MIIRPQIADDVRDYQALVALYKYAYPEESNTLNGLKLSDQSRASEFVCQRWFAEQNGIIIGVGGFEHQQESYQPDKYLLNLIVAQNYQKQGAGTALYNRVIDQLEKRQPQLVQTWVQKDQADSVSFAENRGFSRLKLKWNIRLELQSCNLEPFAEQTEIIRSEGIEIKSLAEMNNDSEHQHKLYELYLMTINNIEAAEPVKQPSFNEFIEQINQHSDELTFVAVHENQYVGMWQLESESHNAMFGGIMAVEKSYRRRGAALALAVHGITRAKFFQYKTLTVHTDEHNKAILMLTEKMGFTHLPAQIFYSKQY